MNDPSSLTGEALAAIGKAQSPAELERIEIEYLGRKTFVQLPLYQSVNGVQLTAKWSALAGVSWRF